MIKISNVNMEYPIPRRYRELLLHPFSKTKRQTALHSVNVTIKKGDRIAQMVVNRVELWEPEIKEELSETVRGEGGFGSTGV